MSIAIYTFTHKKFDVPMDPMYIPLQVGSEGKESFGYMQDNVGENISALNCYYSELTGFYWVWKHDTSHSYIGTCHYRRYLLNEKNYIFTEQELLSLLQDYDVITTKRVVLNYSYHEAFSANHNIAALDCTGEVIHDLYPEYYANYVKLVNGKETYFGNMLITSKAHFASYCSWLFTIFAEVEKRINLDTDEDAYHKRVLGFISEFLLQVWLVTNHLSVKECKVGMLGEKKEVTELKNDLAAFFAKKDIAGAKKHFLEFRQKRPDVLMEASDITGELHLAMQVISTCELEHLHQSPSTLDLCNDFSELMQRFSKLNQIVGRILDQEAKEEDYLFLHLKKYSKESIFVSTMLRGLSQEEGASTANSIFERMTS